MKGRKAVSWLVTIPQGTAGRDIEPDPLALSCLVLKHNITDNFLLGPHWPDQMPLFTLGINHNTAPVEIRERMSFNPQQVPDALAELHALPEVEEAVLLSTCNRTELYCAVHDGGADRVVEWLARSRTPDDPEVRDRFYRFQELDAVRHLLRVASGLDSMVLGEPQILGQIKQAYDAAREMRAVGPTLHRLFQHGFSVAKLVRTDTGIGENPVSVAFAAVNLAKHIFADFDRLTALLIGAGETIELAARHLHEQGTGRMVIANRTVERAHRLASQFGGYAISLPEIPAHLGEADIIISSTASADAVLTRETVAQALAGRKHRPVFMVDIAVPRDIEPAVAELEDVYLYTIDDISTVVESNKQARRKAAEQAERLIELEVKHFEASLRSLGAVPTIRALREHGESLREQTMERAQKMLVSGHSPEEVMNYLATTLTNRLLHAPTARLREAAKSGEAEIIAAAQRLFDLEDDSH